MTKKSIAEAKTHLEAAKKSYDEANANYALKIGEHASKTFKDAGIENHAMDAALGAAKAAASK